LGLPGEHGFRFFPRFYRHIIDTMTRIPFGTGNVAQNLVDTTQAQVARFDRPPLTLPARFPKGTQDLQVAVFAAASLIGGRFDMADGDVAFFARKLWQIVTSCEERRLVEYERINWWDYIEAEGRSLGYQSYFGNGATRSLVAAKAQRASTKTIGDIYVQIIFDLLQPGVSFDRVLNGPTNDVWISPWMEHLKRLHVTCHRGAEVREINCHGGAVESVTIGHGDRLARVEGDYFIFALPVERLARLLSPSLLALDPSLKNLHELTEYVEWMNGIQFYLTEDVPIVPGHTSYIDTPWALTSISQPQFWKDYDLTKYGDGQVRGLLSVCISDWDVRGLNGKEARYCSREEIAKECWQQLKRSLNVGGKLLLRDDQVHSWSLDEDVQDSNSAAPGLETNAEPLLVNYVDTWRLRPEARTRIPNFYLASDYVRTYTDLATMEAANEAARRAVNGVIGAAQVDVSPCELWNLHEPEVFLPLRAYDRIRFRQGLPWDETYASVASAAMSLAKPFRESVADMLASASLSDAGGMSGEAVKSSNSAASTTETAAAARASSDVGLRQLRIVKDGNDTDANERHDRR